MFNPFEEELAERHGAMGGGASRAIPAARHATSLLVAVTLLIVIDPLIPSRTAAWQRQLPVVSSELPALAVDGSGDVVTVTSVGSWKLSAVNGAAQWAQGGSGSMVAVDAADDVVVCRQTLMKLAGASGSSMWDQPNVFDSCAAVAVDGVNDVVAAGTVYRSWITLDDLAVVKLASATGGELWRYELNGNASFYDRATDVGVDAAGDVLVAGYLTVNVSAGAEFQYVVVKLVGASGAELWRAQVGRVGFPRAKLAVDPAGDVILAGDESARFRVVKLAGSSGAELWRQELSGSGGGGQFANAVAVDAEGDVIAGGLLYNAGTGDDFAVVKFDGATGAELWRREIAGPSNRDYEEVRGLAVDGNGDVVAVGRIANATPDHDFDLAVVKLAGGTGAELWRRLVDGTNSSDDTASAVAIDPSGDVAVTGQIDSRVAVLKLRGVDGGNVCAGGPLCGNWCLDPGETCDDANPSSGDGCSALCTVESGWTCAAPPSGCTPVCGDGIRVGNEACDDGNLISGDGCDANCTVTACGNGVVTAGEGCDDGNTVSNDCCSAACQVETCNDDTICTQDACVPGRGCVFVPTPFVECRDALKSSLRVSTSSNRSKDKLTWTWARGQTTALGELGDPRATTDYTLCLYAGSAAALVGSTRVPADAANWQPLGTNGYRYSDTGGTASGIRAVLLKSGANHNAKAIVKGKGAGLPFYLGNGLAFPVRAQWVNENSQLCFESVFTSATENDWYSFKARAP